MEQSIYEKISIVLKLLAKIVGLIFIGYGCLVGLLGIGPDGPATSTGWRLIGFFTLLQGILYFLSNSKFIDSPLLLSFYLVATLSPAIIIIIVTFFSINTSGIESFTKAGGLITVAVLLPISMFAPLSLLFSVISARRRTLGI